MLKTAAIYPPPESCDTALTPRFATPAQFVEPQHDFRLIHQLRLAALLPPAELLTRASAEFYWAAHPSRTGAPQGTVALGNALADLAVTGRINYERFKATPPSEASLVAAVRGGPGLPGGAVPGDVVKAVGTVLDRAYAVAWALRGPIAPQPAARTPAAWHAARTSSLGWIAVCSDSDTPHRPVNLAPPEFQQFDIEFTVPGRGNLPSLPVQTRFFIASAVEYPAPAIVPQSRALPPDAVPHIPDEHQVILFLHGHSSSAEEAGPIISHIHKAGLDRGTKYSVVSLDLPNSGYSRMFDHETVAPTDRTTWPGSPSDDADSPIFTPLLDFIEDYVVAFVDALHEKTPLKNRFAGVIGGSLGGNLGLILGRRPLATNPWLKAGIVSWSPASVWPPKVRDLGQSLGPKHCAMLWIQPEKDNSRHLYFKEVYDMALLGVSQPELWYWDDWLCKPSYIEASRIARQEIYNASFRRWHWRLACEQLIYSHIDQCDRTDIASPLRYQQNVVRQFLVAGAGDDYEHGNIYTHSQNLAEKMVDTPGQSLFLEKTGHSIHIERPHYFAGEIVKFLWKATPLPDPKTIDISFLMPLLLSTPLIILVMKTGP